LALLLWFAGGAAAQDEVCASCHGEKGMTNAAGKSIFVDSAKFKGSIHGGLGCQSCHTDIQEYPHPKKITLPQCSNCHTDEAAKVAKSIHGQMFPGTQACLNCHGNGNVHEVKKAAPTAGNECAACHGDIIKDYQASVHFEARKHGDPASPLCLTCHGSAHTLTQRSDPASPVAKKNLADTCGSCHANPQFLAKHQIDFAKPVEAYRLSVHGKAVAAGNENAPSCSDCHGNHAVFRGRDQRSKINHWNVPATCGTCHKDIQNVYQESVHGSAVARGVRNSPVCTDCHGEHNILAPKETGSLVNAARVSTVTCGHCHSDERLMAKFDLPADKVPTFRDSFHGLASRGGRETVANCASCHGVHNILPSSDPRSTINVKNLSTTCGQCHPGAGERFSIGPIHVKSNSAQEHAVVRFIRTSYMVIIPLTLGFMLLHNGLDFFSKLIRGGPRVSSGEEVPRMNKHFRVAHWLTQISFITLVYTGFALKFPEAWWAQAFAQWEASLALRGVVHRTAAVFLLGGLAYHFVHLGIRKRDRVMLREMIPTIQDLKDMVAVFRYNLGRTKERPTFGMFSYGEKLEYLAYMWGTVVMATTGFLLWFENFTLRNFPSWVADASTAMHWYEAILATAAIAIWHLYAVMFDPEVYPMDKAWITGKVSADHLRHTRPAYYARILTAQAEKSAAEEAARAAAETAKAAANAQVPKATGSQAGPSEDAASDPSQSNS
jgi:formate dehydrogenase gamma subunit